MENIQSRFEIAIQQEKNEKIKLQMNEHEIFLQQALILSVLASLIFVIYFVISSFTSTNNLSKHSGDILK